MLTRDQLPQQTAVIGSEAEGTWAAGSAQSGLGPRHSQHPSVSRALFLSPRFPRGQRLCLLAVSVVVETCRLWMCLWWIIGTRWPVGPSGELRHEGGRGVAGAPWHSWSLRLRLWKRWRRCQPPGGSQCWSWRRLLGRGSWGVARRCWARRGPTRSCASSCLAHLRRDRPLSTRGTPAGGQIAVLWRLDRSAAEAPCQDGEDGGELVVSRGCDQIVSEWV